MTEKVKNLLSMLISAAGMVALVLTTVFCLVTPESIRKDPNSLKTDIATSSAVSTNPLIKLGGAVDADVLAALLAKVGNLESSDSTTQQHMGQINGGEPVTLKLFDELPSVVDGDKSIIPLITFVTKYWQPVYRTGNILTLWMVEPYTVAAFDRTSTDTNAYSESTIHDLMNNTYTALDTTFNLNTKNYIATPNELPVKWQTSTSYQLDSTKFDTSTSDTSTTDNNLMDGGLESDKLWLPSYAEVFNNTTGTFTTNYSDLTVRNGLWQTNYQDREFNNSTDRAWLRSANSYTPSIYVCVVGYRGVNDCWSVGNAYGVRPALHLNLEALQSNIGTETPYINNTPLIKSGGEVSVDTLVELLNKIGALEASDSSTQKSLKELNGGNPVTIKLFETLSDTTNNINLLTSKRWQPVYRTGNILTLWMVEPYTTNVFDSGRTKRNDYAGSDIQKLMTNTYTTLDTNFNLNTKNYIATPNDLPVKWQTGSPQLDLTYYYSNGSNLNTAYNNLMDGGLENDKLWLPSWAEVFNNTMEKFTTDDSDLSVRNGLWQTNYQDRAYTNNVNSNSVYSWLRSALTIYKNACAVTASGRYVEWDVDRPYGVRPALHLNLSSLASEANLKGDVISGSIIKAGGAVDAATLSALLDKMGGLEPTGSEVTKDLTEINGGTPLTLKLFDTVADTINAIDKLTASYWQVVYRTGNVLTLWMTAPYTTAAFDTSATPTNVYESSTLRALLKDTIYSALDTSFGLNSRNLIVSPGDLPVPWQTDGIKQNDRINIGSGTSKIDNNLMDGTCTTDKLWLPSYPELLIYNNYEDKTNLWNTTLDTLQYTSSLSDNVWLRSSLNLGGSSAGGEPNENYYINYEGTAGHGVTSSLYGVRPALHINLDALYATLPGVTATIDTSTDSGARVSVDGGSFVTSSTSKALSMPMQIAFTASKGYTVSGITLNGTALDLTATSAAGLEYVAEYSKDKRTLTLTLTSVTADCNLVASVAVANHTVSVNAYPTGAGTLTGGGTFAHGTSVTLTATAAAGYTFEAWYKDGLYITTNPYTFNVTEDMVILALFSGGGGYNINVLSANAAQGTAAIQSVSGSTLTCLATPSLGYTFTGWYNAATGGTRVSSANPYTTEVTGDTTLYARFAAGGENILSVQSSGGGDARIIAPTTLAIGDEVVVVVAVPYLGYTFTNWTNALTGAAVSTEASYRFTLSEPILLRANFAITAAPTDVMHISHAASLMELSNRVAEGQDLAGVTVILETDIDLGALSREWETIGTATTKFAGIFQGNGHTITNSGASNLNLFATGTTAQVYNLSLGEKVIAGATIQNNGLLPVSPEPDDIWDVNPGGR